MESCWGVYSSFEPPRPGEDALMDDDGLEVTAAVQFREAFAYNAGFPLDEDDVAATNGGALAAALASGDLVAGFVASGALSVRSAAAAAAREWRVTSSAGGDVMADLVYVGAVALGHAERGDGGRLGHVLLPRRVVRDFMLSMGFGVPAAGVPGALEGGPGGAGDWPSSDDDDVAAQDSSDESDSDDDEA